MPTLRLALPTLLLAIVPFVASASDAQPNDSAFGPFLERHCLGCHGSEKPKGGLSLNELGSPSGPDGDADAWSRVAEAIASGDMPPAGRERPDPREANQVARAIGSALAARTGPRPIALRRLNRFEYENTVQDLLGIDTPLADLLPEDGSVQGFDNVTDGLSFSAVLMERYLEAADAAFDGVIRRIEPLPPSTRRVAMMEVKENIDSVRGKKGGTIEVADSFVKFTPGWPPARLDAVHPIEPGVYRCRIAVWPHQPSERTLSVAVYVGPLFGPGQRRFMGMFDVTGTPEDPRVIEFTTRMGEGHSLHIVPWVYPEHVTYRDKHEPRPGIGIVWAETHGPLDQDWPSPAQRRLFGENETLSMAEGQPIYMRQRRGVKLRHVESSDPKADAERIIREFVPRAFRRPVADAVIDPFVALTLERLEQGRTFEQAVRAGVSAVLCSPHFLLLNAAPEVDDHTIASRLSYFLWSTMPDDELLRLADGGRLREPGVLRAQVDRMIDDPRIGRFVENFTGQWLDLREIEFTTPDKLLYPEFDELLQESMLRETRGFFRHVLENDLPVMTFIDSDFTILNERLANHYGIDGVKGHEKFRVVPLPEGSIRGGVLTHASVLKVTANGTATSPILRGVWVLDRILGQPSPPPPPGVPAVEPDIRGAADIREQLALHRSDQACARCHVRIDPPGFALERFDPIGGEREWYRSLGDGQRVKDRRYTVGPPVVSHGELADGRTFDDFRGFRDRLSEEPDLFARAIAGKLLVYATGRPLTAAERPAVEDVVEAARANGLGLRSMIHAVVGSELFSRP